MSEQLLWTITFVHTDDWNDVPEWRKKQVYQAISRVIQDKPEHCSVNEMIQHMTQFSLGDEYNVLRGLGSDAEQDVELVVYKSKKPKPVIKVDGNKFTVSSCSADSPHKPEDPTPSS